jgi:hypothetical protein
MVAAAYDRDVSKAEQLEHMYKHSIISDNTLYTGCSCSTADVLVITAVASGAPHTCLNERSDSSIDATRVHIRDFLLNCPCLVILVAILQALALHSALRAYRGPLTSRYRQQWQGPSTHCTVLVTLVQHTCSLSAKRAISSGVPFHMCYTGSACLSTVVKLKLQQPTPWVSKNR